MSQQQLIEQGRYQDRLLLRPREVAVVTGLSRSMVYELINRGQIPAIRVGKSLRVPMAELQEWIREQAAQQRAALPDGHVPLTRR
jgi:excisionase family DNA binding protein